MDAGFVSTLVPGGLTPALYAGMAAMVFVGACLQGVGGLGFAMFSAPVAALCFPQLVPGPLLALGCPLALMALLREREAIDWRACGYALGGRVAGTALAAACLAMLPVATLSLLFALLILAGVALSVGGLRIAPSGGNTLAAGVASGLMGTITSAGAPPFAIALQHLPPATLRATLGCVFFVGSAISLATLAAVGRMDAGHFVLSALLLPWLIGGFFASNLLKQRLLRDSVRPLLLALAAFGAVGVLVQTWVRH